MKSYKPVTIETHATRITILFDDVARGAMIAAELDDEFIEYTRDKRRNAFVVDRVDAYDAIHKLSFTFDIEVV